MPPRSRKWQRAPGELGLGGSGPGLLGRDVGHPRGPAGHGAGAQGCGCGSRLGTVVRYPEQLLCTHTSCAANVCRLLKNCPYVGRAACGGNDQKVSGFLGARRGPGDPRVFAGKPCALLAEGAVQHRDKTPAGNAGPVLTSCHARLGKWHG